MTKSIIGPVFSKTNEKSSPKAYVYPDVAPQVLDSGDVTPSSTSAPVGYYLIESVDSSSGKMIMCRHADSSSKLTKLDKTGKWLMTSVTTDYGSFEMVSSGRDDSGYVPKAVSGNSHAFPFGMVLYKQKKSPLFYLTRTAVFSSDGSMGGNHKSLPRAKADIGYMDLPFVPSPGNHSTLTVKLSDDPVGKIWEDAYSSDTVFDLAYSSLRGVFQYDSGLFDNRVSPSLYFLDKCASSGTIGRDPSGSRYSYALQLPSTNMHRYFVDVLRTGQNAGSLEVGKDYVIDWNSASVSFATNYRGDRGLGISIFEKIPYGFQNASFMGGEIPAKSVDLKTGLFSLPNPVSSPISTVHWVKVRSVLNEMVPVKAALAGDEPPYIIGFAKSSRAIIPGSAVYTAISGSGGKSLKEGIPKDGGMGLVVSHQEGVILVMSNVKEATPPSSIQVSYDAMVKVSGSISSWQSPGSNFIYTINGDAATMGYDGEQFVKILNRSFDKPPVIVDLAAVKVFKSTGELVFPLNGATCKYDQAEGTLRFSSPIKVPNGEKVRLSYSYETDRLPYAPLASTSNSTIEPSTVILMPGYDMLMDMAVGGVDDVIAAGGLLSIMPSVADDGTVPPHANESHALIKSVSVMDLTDSIGVPYVVTKVTTESPSRGDGTLCMYYARPDMLGTPRKIGTARSGSGSFSASYADTASLVAGSFVSIDGMIHRVVGVGAQFGNSAPVSISPKTANGGDVTDIFSGNALVPGQPLVPRVIVDASGFSYRGKLSVSGVSDFHGIGYIVESGVMKDLKGNTVSPSDVGGATDTDTPWKILKGDAYIWKNGHIKRITCQDGLTVAHRLKGGSDVFMYVSDAPLTESDLGKVKVSDMGFFFDAIKGSAKYLSENGWGVIFSEEDSGGSGTTSILYAHLSNGHSNKYIYCPKDKPTLVEEPVSSLISGETFWLRSPSASIPVYDNAFVHIRTSSRRFPVEIDKDYIVPTASGRVIQAQGYYPSYGDKLIVSGRVFDTTSGDSHGVEIKGYSFRTLTKGTRVSVKSAYENPSQWLVKVVDNADATTDEFFNGISESMASASEGAKPGGIPEISEPSDDVFSIGGTDALYDARVQSEAVWWSIGKLNSLVNSDIRPVANELQIVYGVMAGGTDWVNSDLPLRIPNATDLVAQGVLGGSRLFPSWNSRQSARAFGNVSAAGKKFVSYGSFGVVVGYGTGYVIMPHAMLAQRKDLLGLGSIIPLLEPWSGCPSIAADSGDVLKITGSATIPASILIPGTGKNPQKPKWFLVDSNGARVSDYSAYEAPSFDMFRRSVVKSYFGGMFTKTTHELLPEPSAKYVISYNCTTFSTDYITTKLPLWDEVGFLGYSAYSDETSYDTETFCANIAISRDGVNLESIPVRVQLPSASNDAEAVAKALNGDAAFSKYFLATAEEVSERVTSERLRSIYAGSALDPGDRDSDDSVVKKVLCIRAPYQVGDKNAYIEFPSGPVTYKSMALVYPTDVSGSLLMPDFTLEEKTSSSESNIEEFGFYADRKYYGLFWPESVIGKLYGAIESLNKDYNLMLGIAGSPATKLYGLLNSYGIPFSVNKDSLVTTLYAGIANVLPRWKYAQRVLVQIKDAVDSASTTLKGISTSRYSEAIGRLDALASKVKDSPIMGFTTWGDFSRYVAPTVLLSDNIDSSKTKKPTYGSGATLGVTLSSSKVYVATPGAIGETGSRVTFGGVSVPVGILETPDIKSGSYTFTNTSASVVKAKHDLAKTLMFGSNGFLDIAGYGTDYNLNAAPYLAATANVGALLDFLGTTGGSTSDTIVSVSVSDITQGTADSSFTVSYTYSQSGKANGITGTLTFNNMPVSSISYDPAGLSYTVDTSTGDISAVLSGHGFDVAASGLITAGTAPGTAVVSASVGGYVISIDDSAITISVIGDPAKHADIYTVNDLVKTYTIPVDVKFSAMTNAHPFGGRSDITFGSYNCFDAKLYGLYVPMPRKQMSISFDVYADASMVTSPIVADTFDPVGFIRDEIDTLVNSDLVGVIDALGPKGAADKPLASLEGGVLANMAKISGLVSSAGHRKYGYVSTMYSRLVDVHESL